MKKLLVPTDFSDNANNAIRYATELADLLEASITLVHTYRVYSTSGMFISVESYLKKDAAQHMLEPYEKIEKRLGKERVESKIIRGDTIPVISDMANKSDYDLIVMGTQGAGGLEEIFTGTTTNGVMKKSRKPVLAIPQGFQLSDINNIVLAIDQKGPAVSKVLSPLVKIAQKTDAHVRIFHKDLGGDDRGIDPSIEMYLESVEHSFHYDLDDDRLNESINQFVKDYQADMLAMIRRQRSFLEEVFHVSATTKEVFNSPVPLLILMDQ
jgi:nucleotide-binding universal stress UspA family protein